MTFQMIATCFGGNKIDARKAGRQSGGRQMAFATLCGAQSERRRGQRLHVIMTLAGGMQQTEKYSAHTHTATALPHAMRITMAEIGTTQPQHIVEQSKSSVCVCALLLPLSHTLDEQLELMCAMSQQRCSSCSSHCSSGCVASGCVLFAGPSHIPAALFLLLLLHLKSCSFA